MCTVYSTMNQVNHARMPAEVVQQRFAYARRHPEFVTQLYKIQAQFGRHFLHEHPGSASSWQESCIKKVFNIPGVQRVVGDQCHCGLMSRDNGGQGFARKTAGFMTNSPCIALQLQRRCFNRGGCKIHKHVQLVNGRARAARVYPPELCRAVCRGLIKQIDADKNGQFLLMSIDHDDKNSSRELMGTAKELHKRY